MSENQSDSAGDSSYGSNTRTWSDSQGSVTTNPDTGDINWKYNNGQSGGFQDPGSSPTATANAPPVDQFARLKELSEMFKPQQIGPIGSEAGAIYNAPVPGQDQNLADNQNTYGDTTPSVWKRLGIVPGMDKNEFFDKETKAQRDDRMGMVGNTIGVVGNAFMGAMMPAPVRLGLGLYGAYRGYQNDPNKDVGKAIATGATGLGGYFGAAGNAYLGNYGSAIAGGLAKAGVDSNLGNIAGLGTDYSMGKDVNKPLSMMAGQYVGNQMGGPVGGVFGQNIGKTLASIYGKR